MVASSDSLCAPSASTLGAPAGCDSCGNNSLTPWGLPGLQPLHISLALNAPSNLGPQGSSQGLREPTCHFLRSGLWGPSPTKGEPPYPSTQDPLIPRLPGYNSKE